MKKYQRYLLLSCVLSLFMVCGAWAGNAEAQSRRRPPQQLPPQQLPPQQLPPQQLPPRPPNQPPVQQTPLIQVGVGGSLNIPIDDTDELLDMSGSLHGTLLYSMDRLIKFEADLGYWFLQAVDDEVDDPDDPSLLTLTGGVRYYLNPSFHIDGGLGLYRFSDWEGTIDGDSTSYDDQNELGMYVGVGFEQFPFDVTVRIHHADYYVDDFWNISIGARIFFSASGFSMR